MSTERIPVEFCKGANGLEKVVLREVRGSSAELYLYGAHVTSWKNDHGEELLFVSSKEASLNCFAEETSPLSFNGCGFRFHCKERVWEWYGDGDEMAEVVLVLLECCNVEHKGVGRVERRE